MIIKKIEIDISSSKISVDDRKAKASSLMGHHPFTHRPLAYGTIWLSIVLYLYMKYCIYI